MLLCSWLFQLIYRRNTQGSICQCLNCSTVTLCPKAFQPVVERMLLICLCDTDMSHRKQDVCHWTFLSPWQPCLPMLPCLLLTVLLFPFKVWRTWWWATKVWALFLFHSAFSVFLFCSCFKPSLQRMGKCLQIIWLQIKYITSVHIFSCFFPFICLFDFGFLLWLLFSFILCTIISANKWDIRICDWKFPYIYKHMQLRVAIVKKNWEPSEVNIWYSV